MSLKASFLKKTFKFKFDAGTSRGVLKDKVSYFIFISDSLTPSKYGIGEAAPLKGLSIDDVEEFEKVLEHTIYNFNLLDIEVFDWNISIIVNQLITNNFPSIKFGLETALLDLLNGCKRIIYKNDFSKNSVSIPINGLIWMGDESFMKSQITEKLNEGYATLKLKIGALNFDKELSILKEIRTSYSAKQLTLRVDANGAFTKNEAREVLKELKKIEVHSIEQPIKQGQIDEMAGLCRENIIPIALDEELIGIRNYVEKKQLLKQILPQYIILKPTLVGGFQSCDEWIDAANGLHIDWWITSALESSIGLNAICQYVAQYNNLLPQGLGTGKIYVENIVSPLEITGGNIFINRDLKWEIEEFFQTKNNIA